MQRYELDSKLPQSFEQIILNDGVYKIQMDKYKVLKEKQFSILPEKIKNCLLTDFIF